MTTKLGTAFAAALLVAAAPLAGQGQIDSATPGTTNAVPDMFSVAGPCMACHNGLVSPQGGDISLGTDWRPSMMANAARDPYWQAAVKRETLEHPTAAGAIQDECSKCHMPMARFRAHAGGEEYQAFGRLPWEGAQGRMAQLAADGVSCTLCHQIEAEGLGEEESYTGGFQVDTQTPLGERNVYGPYDVPQGRLRTMLSSGRFQPAQSRHIQESALCASCHTLFTHARDEGGQVVGELPEQVPYLEWLHSDYRDRRSCQSCHMPTVEGATSISSVLPNPRQNVSRHVFRGGNFFMPKVFNAFRDELAVRALPIELDAMAMRTMENLRERTAVLELVDAGVDTAGTLEVVVAVRNQAGHKLPTAYPSRRAWLHVTVTDASDRTVFESGALRPDGSIEGNDNDTDADRYEPHHGAITEPGQVQIYEAVMVDGEDRVTTGLLRGVRYAKDNRLLPSGFDKATAEADVAVRGDAAGDADFVGGSDRVRYRVDVASAARPLRVRAELRYQPIGFRWARNLAEFDAVETDRFVRYYDALSEVSDALLDEAVRTVP